jgi:hypothetical protein
MTDCWLSLSPSYDSTNYRDTEQTRNQTFPVDILNKTLDLESTPGVRLSFEVKYENRRSQ